MLLLQVRRASGADRVAEHHDDTLARVTPSAHRHRLLAGHDDDALHDLALGSATRDLPNVLGGLRDNVARPQEAASKVAQDNVSTPHLRSARTSTNTYASCLFCFQAALMIFYIRFEFLRE